MLKFLEDKKLWKFICILAPISIFVTLANWASMAWLPSGRAYEEMCTDILANDERITPAWFISDFLFIIVDILIFLSAYYVVKKIEKK